MYQTERLIQIFITGSTSLECSHQLLMMLGLEKLPLEPLQRKLNKNLLPQHQLQLPKLQNKNQLPSQLLSLMLKFMKLKLTSKN
jgi:hypothetical protein